MALPLSGYVLAGGKSLRMGEDKARMRFRGVPLVELAIGKLRLGCAQVGILGDRPDLAEFGEIVPDGVSDAGPLAGIVAAFGHAREQWMMLLAVDVPVVPGGLLMAFARSVMDDPRRVAAGFLRVEGRVQPLISVVRCDLGEAVAAALERGERKVLPVLMDAAECSGGVMIEEVEAIVWEATAWERATREFWFANVNTQEEFDRVERGVALGGASRSS